MEEGSSFLLQRACTSFIESQPTTVSEVPVIGAQSSVLACNLSKDFYSLARTFYSRIFFTRSQSYPHVRVGLMEMIGINYATSSHLRPTSQISCYADSAQLQVLQVLGKEVECLPFEIFLNHCANGLQLIIKNNLSDTLVHLCIKQIYFCYTNSAMSADDLSLSLIDNNTRYDCIN